MSDDLLMHAGPPVTWERMSGPQRGAVIGALIFEGRAQDADEAAALAAGGKVRFDPATITPPSGPWPASSRRR